eukprot:TRINITY_DN2673_c0_g1_i1.p1 TRINITY_DN2673_c0_g1~~TRINITY_DN2673_c0_g1_i1.p1  ORF type:complete len:375 (+),score=107.95 TRINITY_DN2673_c0_g1_i1:309-1433(+)
MDTLRKQATKIREQVAKQQQAVLKQFAGSGYGGSDIVATDEAEMQQRQKLERLYASTRAGKHFQRDIVRGVEGIIVTGSKQLETVTRLSEDCRKYGNENPCTTGSTLAKAALNYATARLRMEKERENLHRALGTQIAEPLRAMVMGAPLEDARHLAQRYDRMRQEAEAQASEVAKRQARVRDGTTNPDNAVKLQAAELKLQELKSSMAVLGKEAAVAMAAVEAQQQRLTLQRLIAMVEAERAYHQKLVQILDEVHSEMVSERQRIEAAQYGVAENHPPPPAYEEATSIETNTSQLPSFDKTIEKALYYFGEVIQGFQAETDVELSLNVGDYIVVRQDTPTGWSEGECRGRAGWFPTSHIEKRERALASKVAPVF